MAFPQSKLQGAGNKHTEMKIRALSERRKQGLFNMQGEKKIFCYEVFFQHIVAKSECQC